MQGAAFIASVGLGYIKFDDIPGLIKYNKTFYPDRKNRDIYKELFARFIEIYKNNKSIFNRLNR